MDDVQEPDEAAVIYAAKVGVLTLAEGVIDPVDGVVGLADMVRTYQKLDLKHDPAYVASLETLTELIDALYDAWFAPHQDRGHMRTLIKRMSDLFYSTPRKFQRTTSTN